MNYPLTKHSIANNKLVLAQAACVRHACLLAPCVLACAMRACVRHACLCTPCVLACAMRSLAIVITIVQSFFFSLFLFFFSPSFAFDLLRGISRV